MGGAPIRERGGKRHNWQPITDVVVVLPSVAQLPDSTKRRVKYIPNFFEHFQTPPESGGYLSRQEGTGTTKAPTRCTGPEGKGEKSDKRVM